MNKFSLSTLLFFIFFGSLHSTDFEQHYEPHESETFAFRAKTLTIADQENVTSLVVDAVNQIFSQRQGYYFRTIEDERSWLLGGEACSSYTCCLHIVPKFSNLFADEMIAHLDGLAQNIEDKNLFWNSAEQAIKETLFNFCNGFVDRCYVYWNHNVNTQDYDKGILNLEKNISDKITLKKMFG